ncbi:hypothetical protein AB0L57_22085 [Nocardia sp. NPDC052254]|uniref:hypothetical protein n=1 Tax=Nocardia sp. NPDC052254 TaxID=3155681 RepID=UPI003429AA37
MDRLFLRTLVCTAALAGLFVSQPAGAASATTGTFRIASSEHPGYAMVSRRAGDPIRALPGERGDLWEFVVIDYRPAGPIYQIRNARTRWCLRPHRYDPGGAFVEQGACGVSDYVTWCLRNDGGSQYISLAADPQTIAYGTTTTGPGMTVIAGHGGNGRSAHWILRPA